MNGPLEPRTGLEGGALLGVYGTLRVSVFSFR